MRGPFRSALLVAAAAWCVACSEGQGLPVVDGGTPDGSAPADAGPDADAGADADAGPLVRPNVVLFVVDDMGWTDWQADPQLNPTGSIVYETPSMLRLAGQGVTFSQAYAAAPVCSPTRAALLTGKTPARLRITDYIPGQGNETASLREPADWVKNLPASEVTLAEALATAGYATGFFGKWHLGEAASPAADPLQNGFEVNVGGVDRGNPNFAGGYFAGADGAWAGMPGLDTPGTYPPDAFLSDALAEQAEAFIAQAQQGDRPFFLMMSHYVVHTPLEAPTDLITKYSTKIATLQSQGRDLRGHDDPTYAAMVEKMDQSLGRLLDRLDDPDGDGSTEDGIRDETIIVFVSDNGGLFPASTGNSPLREGKGSLYEGGIREPFLVSWTGSPNLEPGSRSAARTSSHDVYPTLLALTQVAGDAAQNASMDGVSIVAALEGDAFDRSYQYWHYPHISPQDNNYPEIVGGTFVSAVRSGEYKLLYFYDDQHFELFDLAGDIGETTNLIGASDPARVAAHELSQALHDHLEAVGAQTPLDTTTNQPVPLPPVLPAP